MNGRVEQSHRVSYAIYRGNVPKGMVVMHSCHNKLCVNPDHLSIGDQTANRKMDMDRGAAVGVPGNRHNAKLDKDEVILAREVVARRLMSQRDVAKALRVSEATMSLAIRGYTWPR